MLRVALAQMNTSGAIVDNQKNIQQYAQQACQASCDYLLLPEMCLSLASDDYPVIANDSSYLVFFSELARHYGLAIVVGAIPQPSPINGQHPRSAQLLFDRQGQIVQRYDKRHLFDVEVDDPQGCYRESDSFSAGHQMSQFSDQQITMGMSICFDLRFPDHYQKLRQAGADVMIVAAAFTYVTGEAHWQTLLQARAIETQSYILAVNQCGWHDDKRQSWGHSMVIDPWGKILCQLAHQPDLLIAEIDPREVERRRRQMPLQPAS